MFFKFYALALLFILSSSLFAADRKYSQEELGKSLRTMNRDLPMNVDGVTTVTGVVLLPNKIINYRYSLDVDKIFKLAADHAKISVEELKYQGIKNFGSVNGLLKVWFDSDVKLLILRKNCTTPATREWIENDVKLVHTIYSLKGVYFNEFSVNKGQCLNY